jgi:hypothetical protein
MKDIIIGSSENFTKIASPLFLLLSKTTKLCWTTQCQIAFEALKEKLLVASMLRGLNWYLAFHISTNASNTTIGVVLVQKEY